MKDGPRRRWLSVEQETTQHLPALRFDFASAASASAFETCLASPAIDQIPDVSSAERTSTGMGMENKAAQMELRSALNRLVPEDRTLAPPPSTRSAMEWYS